MMTETIFNPMADFITRNINTIEGLPMSGRGYLVTDIKYETDVVPIIEVEMRPDAFRAAIGYLNRDPFSAWTGPGLANKKKKLTIEKVIYNPPATIVWFNTGNKVVSKAEEGDEFDWETGLAICLLKERMDKKTYNRLHPYFFEGDTPLWDTLVRMECPNGEWEKIKKEWKR